MVAQFQHGGALYKYEGVPIEVFVAVITADSQGSAFDKLVKKGAYPFTRITAEDVDAL